MIFNKEFTMHMAGGDHEFYEEMLVIIRKNLPDYVSAIKTAIESADTMEIAMAAHKLKGGLSNYGAEDSIEVVRRVEQMAKDNNLGDIKDVFVELKNNLEEFRKAVSGSAS